MSIKLALQVTSIAALLILLVFNLLIYRDIREAVNILKENHQLEYELAQDQRVSLEALSKAIQENHDREYQLALEQGAVITKLEGATTDSATSQLPSVDDSVSSSESDETVVTTASGLQYEVLASGDGESPSPGDTAVVHYTGWLTDGTKFDSSVDREQPFEFGVGQGNVIQGWDEGVALMKVGDKWKFTIPSELAYGERSVGNGLIPPNSTLVFEVQLLDVK